MLPLNSSVRLLAALLLAPSAALLAKVERLPDGIVAPVEHGFLKIQVRTPAVFRVISSPDRAFFEHPSLMVVPSPTAVPAWTFAETPDRASVSTNELTASIDLHTGAVSFLDLQGHLITRELPGSREFAATEVQGEKTYHVAQSWAPQKDEALFGLGQQQFAKLNLKGRDLELWQHNTNVVVPFLVSSRGYGILWDNQSYSRFGDRRPYQPLGALHLFDVARKPGSLTASYFGDGHFEKPVDQRSESSIDFNVRDIKPHPNIHIHPKLPDGDVSVRWEGEFESEASGVHQFHTFSDGGIRVWIDDRLVINHWRQNWLPSDDVAQVSLSAHSHHKLKIEWVKDQDATTVKVDWKSPNPSDATTLWSEVGGGIDYYFAYGPEIEQVVAGYRQLTGPAVMVPQWALGLWQSRQRYETAQQSLDVIDGFRSRGIPFDNIVQDWQYWHPDAWGSHDFDPSRFPDPDAWIKAIHEKHSHVMISVWGKFYPGTENFRQLKERGFLYQPNLDEHVKDWLDHEFTFYDAFNPEARKLFWQQIDQHLFRRGIDAWWMDASEPDLAAQPGLEATRLHMQPLALGTPSHYLNGYALENARGIYEGQRQSAPNQRVFNLTRSGGAGQQRYGAATWSGDITSTWTALNKQIAAGLGFSISGVPYWTMDCGGFSVPQRFMTPTAADTEEWRELNVRWFQFATFVPLLRVHGEMPFREMWEVAPAGTPAYQALFDFDRLRYQLFPYLYSMAGAITQRGSTLMRPLVMDFSNDPRAIATEDEYMFGPAFLVSPVVSYQQRSRPVYLPKTNGGWYDFWTGRHLDSGKTVTANAPFEKIPVHIRAGTILPTGPDLQYTGEKPADPITVYVYGGANGDFTLYEDDGLTYGYEKGEYSTIGLHWDDASQTLTFNKRQGAFPGMLTQRTFQVVLVSAKTPVGYAFQPKPAKTVQYTGESAALSMR